MRGGSVCFARDGENDFHAIFDNQPCCRCIHRERLWRWSRWMRCCCFRLPQGSALPDCLASWSVPVAQCGAVGRENRMEEDAILKSIWIPSPAPR